MAGTDEAAGQQSPAQSSAWVEKNSRGYTYGAKVYRVPGNEDELVPALTQLVAELKDQFGAEE